MRPQTGMELGETCLKTQKGGDKCVLLSCRSLGNGGTLFEKARRARIRNRLRSVNGHAEQKGFKVWRTGNSPKIQERHNGGDGQWRSADERGSLGKCSRSSSLRDCAELLEDTLAVMTSRNFCEEHGYTHEWASGQNPHLTKMGRRFNARMKISCLLLSLDCHQVPAQVRLLHRSRRTHRAH